MTKHIRQRPFHASPAYRLATVLFGLVFIAIGIYALFFAADPDLLIIAAGIVFGALGLEAVTAAVRGKPALLSRIGPLP